MSESKGASSPADSLAFPERDPSSQNEEEPEVDIAHKSIHGDAIPIDVSKDIADVADVF